MVNVLIPITDNLKEYVKMISEISLYEDINLIVGVTADLNEKIVREENVNYFVFQNGANKEEILNSLTKFVLAGKILVLRKVISNKDFEKILSKNKPIVLAQQKQKNKVSTFFAKIWHFLVSIIFGVSFYEGNTSVMMFDEDLSEVLLQTGNFSYNTRVNRWKGVKEKTVVLSDDKETKYPIDKKQNVFYSVVIVSLISVAVIATILIALFANLNFIFGLMLVCFDIICVIISLLLLMMIIFNNKVGKKDTGEAILIED